MKKVFFLSILFSAFTLCSKAQFSAAEKAQIQQILGNDFKAVIGKSGQLAIVAPRSVRGIKSAPRGGFRGLPSTAANATLAAYEKFWVYKQSSKDLLVSKLGQERFEQLSKIMLQKGLNVQ